MDLVAWFGPCISQDYFEVGSDVYDIFVSQDDDFKHAFKQKNSEKYLFDMKYVATKILNNYNCGSVVD